LRSGRREELGELVAELLWQIRKILDAPALAPALGAAPRLAATWRRNSGLGRLDLAAFACKAAQPEAEQGAIAGRRNRREGGTG